MQHGSAYCEQHDTWREYTDISRCSYFISYGFTKNDMKRVLPREIFEETAEKVTIIPLGTTKKINRSGRVKSKKVVDVLFPITYVKRMLLGGGCARVLPHVLSDRAIDLLHFLDRLNVHILIKPMLNTSYENSVFLPILKRLKNRKIIIRSDLPLIHYLEQYHVRSVMLEYASTPLYECLPYDIEIFAMFDPVRPYTKAAMNLLKKRVILHLFAVIK